MNSHRTGVLFLAIAASLIGPAARGQDDATSIRTLEQGWDDDLRNRFYHTPQGSPLIPYDWFLGLERADGELFSAPASLERYGLLRSQTGAPLNPDGLPIGFTIEAGAAAPDLGALALSSDPSGLSVSPNFVGLTCAACHTAVVKVEGQTIRIDGAPANFDFDSFYADLSAVVTRTTFDEAHFERFAARVIAQPRPTDLPVLKLRLAALQVRLSGEAALRRPTVASGFGRVDALTQIVNSLAVRDQSAPENIAQVAAPTSYPPLWLTPRLEYVQWNPIASSPLARNAGQVLGVLGAANLAPGHPAPLRSTIKVHELIALEDWVAKLAPPKWDEALMGAIDRERAAAGEALFRSACNSCHSMPPYRETSPDNNFFGKTFIAIAPIEYDAVGTDPAYVEALSRRNIATNALTAPLFGGQEIVPALGFFTRVVGAVLTQAMDDAGLAEQQRIAANGFRLRAGKGGAPEPYDPPSRTALKAGPLAGVWATGPYLHNGSVATIYELLSPPAERRKVFWTGGRELDREHLGFISDDAPGRFRLDANVPGNLNIGHLYPPEGLNPEQRLALIEYLKAQ